MFTVIKWDPNSQFDDTTGGCQLMRQMDFKNPKFNRGLNFTVRNGEKWQDATIGEQLALTAAGETEAIGVASVTAVIKTKLEDVPEYVLENEHAPDARELNGLYDAMKDAYGDLCDWDSTVICVGFRLVKYLNQ